MQLLQTASLENCFSRFEMWTTYDTIIGPVRFEKQSNVSTQPGISQIQNGIPELVYPPSIATSKFQPKVSWD